MKSYSLVLASSSIYRQQLLSRLGQDFETASPEIDETALAGEKPESLAQRLAREKATALTKKFPEHLIIGSDQVACCEEEILGKPGNYANAQRQLQRQSGRSVDFFTAVAVLNSETGKCLTACDITRVRFRSLSEAQVKSYLQIEQPFDCAGSFKCEGLGICLFEKVQSEDPTGLIGLPLIKTTSLLNEHGLQILDLLKIEGKGIRAC